MSEILITKGFMWAAILTMALYHWGNGTNLVPIPIKGKVRNAIPIPIANILMGALAGMIIVVGLVCYIELVGQSHITINPDWVSNF